ncbi:Protein transporter of the TRAM (translocating chain-associating membrane) superfamily [Phaffia rhodozyma]|uniref:Protein transporter of the TRAM (Translocating chain-associating membrane) superfamily n=1 Tax=Phaffia rhodozyma TaxID=264483 RepID=A0A0F7STI6_PHARH|nr:Protein transporter of the TRAM (translocating chain-associating membrane) superfamily [Phaffia rhodozyma]
MSRPRARSRSDSINNILSQVPLHSPTDAPSTITKSSNSSSGSPGKKLSKKVKKEDIWAIPAAGEMPASFGFWKDLTTGRWMLIPASSGIMLAISFALYLNYELIQTYVAPVLPATLQIPQSNPFAPLWFISYPLPAPHSQPGDPRFGKGLLDVVFLLHHIVTFSFIRQAITLYILRPLAKKLGIRGSKILRFQEQAYSAMYYGSMGFFGLYLMTDLPTWYFNTEEFWIGYPHWEMKATIKYYYLLQFSYWLQQMFILVLKIEKPRKDYAELVMHHCVTLWLIGWSYAINLTMIGNAVFVTMDISDVFLALAKCVNYSEGPKSSGIASTILFGWFVIVWTYLRHYLNFIILWSVWFEFDLIPEYAKQWNPPAGVWMVHWMKYQIFIPIMLIQLLNLFWYFLIWRVLIRSIRGTRVQDERSDDEDEDEKVIKKTQ